MKLTEITLQIDSGATWSRVWLEGLSLSEESRFTDEDWYLDNPTHGQGRSTSSIHWSLSLGDGSNLLDEENADLLFWMKAFIISLFVFPQPGVKLFKPGSARILFLGLRLLVRWMVDHSFSRLDQLDRYSIDSYMQDLPKLLAQEVAHEDGIGIGTAWRSVRTLILLWKQGPAFVLLGIGPVRDRPWSGLSGKKIARDIADKIEGWIPPLPDEVAVPILNKAWWFLSGPHLDILKAKSISDEVYSSLVRRNKSRSTTLRDPQKLEIVEKALVDFSFSILPGESLSWFEWNLGKCIHRQLGRLCRGLVSACLVVLQATTGMRASEICGLPAIAPDENGLPGNVRIENSISGNSEMFILVSEISKGEAVPRPAEWLLGARVTGESDYPLPVVALSVLNKIYKSFEGFNSSEFLLSSWISNSLPRSANGLKRFTGRSLRIAVKSFVQLWVSLESLPDQSENWVEPNDLIPWKRTRGAIIKTHQFRKTFANFALGVDSKLLPAVQMQFHHVSVTVTESNYWGRFRTQVDAIHSAQQQRTAFMLYEMATGNSLAAGRQAHVLRAWIAEIKELVCGKSRTQAWADVRKFMFEKGLVVWFAPHGSCLPLDDAQMQCHKIFGSRPLLGRSPNYRGQQPSVCTGCQCFIVSTNHLGFWQERYREYSTFLESSGSSATGALGVIRARADQARKVINLLTVPGELDLGGPDDC